MLSSRRKWGRLLPMNAGCWSRQPATFREAWEHFTLPLNVAGTLVNRPVENGYRWLHKTKKGWRLPPVDAEPYTNRDQVMEHLAMENAESAMTVYMALVEVSGFLFQHPVDPDKMAEVRR